MAQTLLYNSPASMGESRGINTSEFQFDRNITRNPDSVITIFTVNTRDQYSPSAGMRFPGRAAGERIRKVASLTDPKYFHDVLAVEGQKNKRQVIPDDGRWVAMDWLNPNNCATLDQNYEDPNAGDDGTNLLARGLFFIVRPFDPVNGNIDDQPTEEEIKAAEARLAKRYTGLVRIYHQISTATPNRLPQIMNEEMVDALNFAGLSTPYNTTLQQKISCPTCGDMKVATAKFHRSESLGVICIEPTKEGWSVAVAAGVKKMDEVPEEFRDKRGPGRPPMNRE